MDIQQIVWLIQFQAVLNDIFTPEVFKDGPLVEFLWESLYKIQLVFVITLSRFGC